MRSRQISGTLETAKSPMLTVPLPTSVGAAAAAAPQPATELDLMNFDLPELSDTSANVQTVAPQLAGNLCKIVSPAL